MFKLIEDKMLGEEGLILMDALRSFAKNEITFERSKKMDENHKIDSDLIKQLGDLGIFAAQIPEKYGGIAEGDDYGNRVLGTLIQEELAYHDPNIAICVEVSSGLSANCIVTGGNEKQKKLYLPKMASGEIIGAFALSEPNSGSDAGALESKINKNVLVDGKSTEEIFVLNGTKQFITNGAYADLVIWFARNGNNKKDIGAYVVEKFRGYKVNIENNLGQKATGTSQLSAQDLLLAEDLLLNGKNEKGKSYKHKGLSLAFKILDDGRLHVAGDALGMMKRAIDESVKYANERETYGKKLKEYQTIQNMMADMKINYEVCRAFVYKVAYESDKNGKVNTKIPQ